MLVEKTQLKAVIAMPSGVFKPYAGVSTAILVFTKGGETNDVWFYNMEADGYSLDDKRSKIYDSDLTDISNRFKIKENVKANDRKQKYFFVNREEITANNYDLNLSTYKEEEYAEIKYNEPKIILSKLEKLETNIQKALAELNDLIK
jgi:type I restriction enzyme M protein